MSGVIIRHDPWWLSTAPQPIAVTKWVWCAVHDHCQVQQGRPGRTPHDGTQPIPGTARRRPGDHGNPPMKYGSLFTGGGGMDLGCDAAGWDCRWQCEIEPSAHLVLEARWPGVERHWDVHDVNGALLEPVDVITFGFPCQDVSQSGKRAGVDGERTGLYREAMRIVREMKEATDGTYPRWVVIENVDGLRHLHRSRGLLRVLRDLADLGAVAVEWAVLDGQHFGVPQQRRRVVVVAGFDPRTLVGDPGPLLPLAEGSARDHRARRQDGNIAADQAAARARGDWSWNIPVAFHLSQRPIAWEGVAPTMGCGSSHGMPSIGVLESVSGRVRALTFTEAERIMGWPDGHTAPCRGWGKRWRLLGNGVIAPMAQWVAEQINAEEERWQLST